MNRRTFLKSTSVGAAGAVSLSQSALASLPGGRCQEPIRQTRDANIRLGLAAYSFRQHFAFSKGQPNKSVDAKQIDMFEFIDYCAQQHCAAELTSYFFSPAADSAYFHRIKRHAFLNGVPIVGTAIGNDFMVGNGKQRDQRIEEAKKWIDRAALMGAPHIRFFAGTRKQLESDPAIMAIAIDALQRCCDYAAQAGIFIGVENHGQLTADQVLEIVKGVKSKWFGINLDTGNFISDDPYRDLEKCAPFAVNVQLKVKMKSPAGEIYDADFERIGKILARSGYRGYLVLEFEEDQPFLHVPKLINDLQKQLVAR